VRAATAYKRVGDSTSVMAADPLDLIILLYEKLLHRLRETRVAIGAADVAARGRATSAAIEIISNGLIGALDMERGGDVAIRLKEQYQLWLRMLLQINLNGDLELLSTLELSVGEILSAWKELKAQPKR
jgi:flagellar protein FliS